MNDQADTDGKTTMFRNLPVPCSPRTEAPRGGAAAVELGFKAQMLGTAGQRRGLKGGTLVLQAARRAYLEAEWSGPDDRRAGLGSAALKRI